MKIRALFILVLLIISTLVRASYFDKLPYTIKQPDGTTIKCFISGDEFYNWIHDANGYTIIQASNGYYYYAERSGDLIQPSKYLVNSFDPASVGLSKWVKISKSGYEQKRSMRLSLETSNKGTNNAPQTGILNNLVIYIRFLDDPEFITTRGDYDNMFNSTTAASIKSYYNEYRNVNYWIDHAGFIRHTGHFIKPEKEEIS